MAIKKLQTTQEFVVDLSIQLRIEDKRTNFTILSDAIIPFQQCDENKHYLLPGDGTVSGFVSAVGESVGESAIDAVLNHLGIGQYISDAECSIPENDLHLTGMITYNRLLLLFSIMYL